MQPKPSVGGNPLPVGGKHMGNYPGKPDNTNRNKMILLAAGVLGLIFLISMIFALAPKDPAPTQFFSLAQTQQEVVRLCTQGSSKAKYRSTRNFAVTCSTGITTSQKDLLAYMSKVNYPYEPKQLGGKADGQADAKLKSAASSSTYDDVFRDILETKLTAYSRALTAQLAATNGANGRDLLSKNQRAADLLLVMVKDDSDKTEAAPVEG